MAHVIESSRPEIDAGRAAAARMRAAAGFDPAAPIPCIVGYAEQTLGLDVVIAPLRDHISGFYIPVHPRPVIVVTSKHPAARQRFTIAHEIGHHALGHGASPRIHADTPQRPPASAELAPVAAASHSADHYAVRSHPQPDERAANAFAGELLVPDAGAAEVVGRWDGEPLLDQTVRLSAHYGVSAFSAIVKLHLLGRVSRQQRDQVRELLADGQHIARYRELGLGQLPDVLHRHEVGDTRVRCNQSARALVRRLRAELDASC